jgi:hypothetical protein
MQTDRLNTQSDRINIPADRINMQNFRVNTIFKQLPRSFPVPHLRDLAAKVTLIF